MVWIMVEIDSTPSRIIENSSDIQNPDFLKFLPNFILILPKFPLFLDLSISYFKLPKKLENF